MDMEDIARSDEINEYREIISQLRIIDDVLMTLVFDDDPETTEVLLNVILDRDDLKVLSVTSQREVKNPNGRSVRFDIYAIDAEGRHYDIELQRSDKGADERRARFNSSMLDSKLLEAGQDTSELVDAYVIFITENDVRKKGRALYRIERMDADTHELFDDGSHIIYVNGAYDGDDRVGRLMHDLRCTSADEMHNAVLAKRMRYFKEPEGGNGFMCKALEDFAEKKEREIKIKMIPDMLKFGISIEAIAEIFKMTIEEVTSVAMATGK